jgi:ribosome silencing factor RsfS/YbeB/iojap
MTLGETARAVRTHLAQDHRFAHTLRVARLAGSLARAHNEDVRAAVLAALLHDLARLLSGEELLRECAARGMAIDSFERAHPVVLHARLGALLAREKFGVQSPRVLSAIEKHTLGAVRMTHLDEIVYLADSLEPGREYPGRAALLRVAYTDLAAAMRLVLRSSADHLRAQGRAVAPLTALVLQRYEGTTSLPDLIDLALEAAEEKKAEDLVTLQLSGRTIVADAFIIATGRSKIQTRAIADAVSEAVRGAGYAKPRTEGYVDGGWILIDLGAVIVHVFTPEQRAFYNLERLWGATDAQAAAQSS